MTPRSTQLPTPQPSQLPTPLEVPTGLVPHVAAEVLTATEARLAQQLCRLAGDDGPEVLLGAALALRGPRFGHVCVELDAVAGHLVDAPPTEDWLQVLAASPAVRPGGPGSTPLVLDARRLYLDRYWQYEQQLATALAERAAVRDPDLDTVDLRGWLDAVFGPATGPDRQRLAAALAVLRRLTVIAGGPGTGKTYTVVRVLAVLHAAHSELRAVLAAPTGKAAARLQESLRDGLAALPLPDTQRGALARTPALTLHRLLGVQRGSATRFRHDADHPLPFDVVIVDEASMVSLPLMAKLVAAVRPDARLILLGDRDQLASVEAGAAFGDLCGPDGSRPVLRLSAPARAELEDAAGIEVDAAAQRASRPGIWDAVVRLDRFRRYDAGSDVAAAAAAIQQAGHDPEGALQRLRGRADGALCRYDPERDPAARDRLRAEVVDAYAVAVRLALAGADAREVLAALGGVRVLCALRRGPDGAQAWNASVAAGLAAVVPGFRPEQQWYVGRPVLVTVNDPAVRLSNGDVGVVVADADDPERRVVAFPTVDGSVRRLSPARLPDCETTFAMTIHKSQGSQFAHAAVVLPVRPSPVLTRELVYTALTRASQRASLYATDPILRATLARPVQRASGLQPRLWGPAISEQAR